ncbi:hypothetical protein DL96DRAFT_144571 [Flagelloscypha sp. PMI_526]|nr:hypothetical protein DL96DRAFT_144571 [Flagelloscypha sp. PMI_526]
MRSPLDIPELKLLLCTHIQDKPTLARLARTSSQFRDCALDTLYSDHIWMPQLIQCVPQNVFQAMGEEDHRLLQNTVELNTENIMKYFRRVKNLHISAGTEAHDQWLPILQALAQLVPCFFPNLRQLFLLGWNSLSMSHPTLFFPPSLRMVAFSLEHDALFVAWFPALMDHCPELRKVFLLGIEKPETEQLILPSFLSWRNLKHVSFILTISPLTVQTLALHPSLESLTLPPIRHPQSSQMPYSCPLPPESFCSLRKLSLFKISFSYELPDFLPGSLPSLLSLDLDRCSRCVGNFMLERVSQVPLEDLKAVIENEPVALGSRSDMNAFIGLTQPFIRSLTTLFIKQAKYDNPAVQFWPFEQVCGHLLSFSQLKEVIIKVGPGFTMAQNDVDRIGNRWKELTVFQLRLPRHTEVYNAGLSLEEFSRFMAACPRLKKAKIPFSAVDVPTHLSSPPNINLDRLNVGCAPIGNGIEVAKFLQQMFPRIHHFSYYQKNVGSVEDVRWTQVEQRLRWLNDRWPSSLRQFYTDCSSATHLQSSTQICEGLCLEEQYIHTRKWAEES